MNTQGEYVGASSKNEELTQKWSLIPAKYDVNAIIKYRLEGGLLENVYYFMIVDPQTGYVLEAPGTNTQLTMSSKNE